MATDSMVQMEALAEMLGACMDAGHEDGAELRTCVLQQLPEQTAECKMEAVLVAQDGCEICDKEKASFAGLPVRVISPEQADAIEPVDSVPQLWIVDCAGNKLADLELE